MCASKLYKVLLLALIVWGCEPETAAERPALVAELPDGTEMAFVWIDPGTFVMGSPPTEPGRDDDEAPHHEVQITQGFYLAQTEITQQQWTAVMDTQPWAGLDFVLKGPKLSGRGPVVARRRAIRRGPQRQRRCPTLPLAHGSRVGIRLPNWHHHPLVLWRRRGSARRLCLAHRQYLGCWTATQPASGH